MDIITLARELGAAIQQDELYIDYKIKEQNKEKKNKIVLFYGKFITISDPTPENNAYEYTNINNTINVITKNKFFELLLFILPPLIQSQLLSLYIYK